MPEVWMNIVTEGYVRKSFTPKYEVWMNIVIEGYVRKNYTPKYEVWMNIVTEGYVRSTYAFRMTKIETISIVILND